MQKLKPATCHREEKLSEKELVNAAQNGNKKAFQELIKKYEHQVAATVIGMLGHCPEAEDVGQETFIRFYRSLERFKGKSGVRTYLTRIAINLSLNELKRRQRKRGRFSSRTEAEMENLPDKHEKNQRKELKDIVQTGIQKLDPKHRTVIVLRLIDGYSTSETAQILKLPIGTVLSRLARAQIKLKEILAPLYWDTIDSRGEENG